MPEAEQQPTTEAQSQPKEEPAAPPKKTKFSIPSPVFDVLGILLALAVLVFGGLIWFKPPLLRAAKPFVTYGIGDQSYTNATLYRPLAMPSRYYIEMPRLIAGRYQWFVVDRRREVAAILTNAPVASFWGTPAIRRSDPLGLDLEFRKMDHSEWRVAFDSEAIVFSNAILRVEIRAQKK